MPGVTAFGFFQTQFKAHHEVAPSLGIALQRVEQRLAFLFGDAVLRHDFKHFLPLVLGFMNDFMLLTTQLGFIMMLLGACRHKTTKAHGH